MSRDFDKAVELFKLAATKGEPEAYFSLGDCYYFGLGVEQSYEDAFALYQISAELGVADAQYYLGWCYYYGEGVEKDEEMGMMWADRAFNNGFIPPE